MTSLQILGVIIAAIIPSGLLIFVLRSIYARAGKALEANEGLRKETKADMTKMYERINKTDSNLHTCRIEIEQEREKDMSILKDIADKQASWPETKEYVNQRFGDVEKHHEMRFAANEKRTDALMVELKDCVQGINQVGSDLRVNNTLLGGLKEQLFKGLDEVHDLIENSTADK